MAIQSKPTASSVARHPDTFSKPTRVGWLISDLLSRDGHVIQVGFTCNMTVVNEPAEQKMLREVFGQSGSLSLEAVISHFLPSLRTASSEMAAGDTTENLLSPDRKADWTKILKNAANEVAFSCGLDVLAPFDVAVTSPSLQRERSEQMQRVAAERRSADRAGHFARAAELLKQWESLKSSVPSVTPGRLLEHVNPSDQGLMLDTLLMASAGTGAGQSIAQLWAVSGQSLVRVDFKSDLAHPSVIALPTTIGPLRSISPFQNKLLIGARGGVMVADPSNAQSAVVYSHIALVSEHGFTSVTQIGDQLWGCHRIGGLVGWKIGEPQRDCDILSPAQLGGEPKHLIAGGLFAVGNKVLRLLPALKVEPIHHAGSAVVAILAAESVFIIAQEDGLITLLDQSTFERMNEIQTTGRLTGAALLPWLSSWRLLLNRADGGIDCIGLEDQLLTQYSSGQTGLRAVTACAAKVAAMTSDRQRILMWNPWNGRRTAGEVHLTGLTHHRIADLAFVQL